MTVTLGIKLRGARMSNVSVPTFRWLRHFTVLSDIVDIFHGNNSSVRYCVNATSISRKAENTIYFTISGLL